MTRNTVWIAWLLVAIAGAANARTNDSQSRPPPPPPPPPTASEVLQMPELPAVNPGVAPVSPTTEPYQAPPAMNGAPPPMAPVRPYPTMPAPAGEQMQTMPARDPSNQRFDDAPAAAPAPPQPTPVFSLFRDVKLLLGGTVTADFLFSSARPVAPGTPFFLTPGPLPGRSDATFDALARQSALFALFEGPDVWDFHTGGVVLVNFYDNAVIVDRYGLLPIEAFGHLMNEDWRFAAGLQLDIFNPRLPTVLPFSMLAASGNTGFYRGQARLERYLYPSDESQITLQAGISDPISTFLSDSFNLSEDNGWPNVEGRAVFGLGERKGVGILARRPFEIAASGVVGQIRTVTPEERVVADVWGLGADLRWEITERFGTKGEYYIGQTLGTYGGGILQNVNPVTFQGIEGTGGWLELFYYLRADLHTHVGYGVDTANRRDLAPGQLSFNDTIFANLIWDVSKTLRFAIEGTYRRTNYVDLFDNDGFTIHTQAQWKF